LARQLLEYFTPLPMKKERCTSNWSNCSCLDR